MAFREQEPQSHTDVLGTIVNYDVEINYLTSIKDISPNKKQVEARIATLRTLKEGIISQNKPEKTTVITLPNVDSDRLANRDIRPKKQNLYPRTVITAGKRSR